MLSKNAFPFFYSTIFSCLFIADLLVRLPYQAGKSPVLQILALQIDATPALLGFIVSVSTITGVIFKPLIGWISDRNGRWFWLLLGTSLFCVPSFLYVFIDNPEQLVFLRLIHGFSTAIYGPITMAYIGEIAASKKTEYYSWFGLSKIASYVVGPLLGAYLITLVSPQAVYTIIGGISLLAFLPLVFIKDQTIDSNIKTKQGENLRVSFVKVIKNRAVSVVAIMEIQTKATIYALKAFLPVMMLTAGAPIIEIGVFLSLQEASNATMRSFSGRIALKVGIQNTLVLGLGIISISLFILSVLGISWSIWLVAMLIGFGQAIFGPASEAIVAELSDIENLGFTFGVVGSMKNAGKVAGPILAGVLASFMEVQTMFAVIATIPLILSVTISLISPFKQSLD